MAQLRWPKAEIQGGISYKTGAEFEQKFGTYCDWVSVNHWLLLVDRLVKVTGEIQKQKVFTLHSTMSFSQRRD